MSDHLITTSSDRGFDYLPSIPSEYGGGIDVHESSAASGPHLWVTIETPDLRPGGPAIKAAVHLTAENGWRLSEQLQKLVREHYQGDATPEWVQ